MIVVSLTSHGDRLKYVAKSIFSILIGSYKDVKICLTLYKDDCKYIPEDLQLMIDANVVELIIADNDLGPHLKYFYAMKKYKDNPLITIDDDVKYYPTTIENLVNSYEKFPHCISARRCHKILYTNTSLLPYKKWAWEEKNILTPSKLLFATGVGGVLYPPNILDIDSFNLDELLLYKYNDDIYLKVIELRKKILTVWSKCKNNECHPIIWNKCITDAGLCKINNSSTSRNDEYLKNIKLFELLNN